MFRPNLCEKTQPLLSGYADGTLDASERARLETHLTACPDCARLAGELRAVRNLLHGLPARQTSTNFEASLAARLVQTQSARPASNPPPTPNPVPAMTRRGPRFLRPIAALATGAVALAGVLLTMPTSSPDLPTTPAVVLADDPSLVSHCVAQHRQEVAAQPLSDLSAQLDDTQNF